jgi:type IV secretory pathway VirJ component
MIRWSQWSGRALVALIALIASDFAFPRLVRAQGALARDSNDVHGLPIIPLHASGHSQTLAIVLSGDGGWADIDKQIGETLATRGVDVVGFDDRAYLFGAHRDADGTARDVSRVARHFMPLWGDDRLVLIGYSRGAALVPFVATRLPEPLRGELALVAMLGLPIHASFKYRFSDLWATRTRAQDTPILPELVKLRGTNMMCVYGRQEDESLCRSITDTTLVHPYAREGKHHFDGDYRAITDQILARLGQASP